MGTWTRNFLVPKGDPNALRDTIKRWLERKGFDQVERSLSFADDSNEERAAFFVSNAHWSVIIYREAFNEGDRLVAELGAWPVVMEIVIADSDVWAYELIENGQLTAAFNSNPRHFGGNDQKLPQNGDPKRLCRALGMEWREAEISRVQRRRSLFSDIPCQTFCRLIGAPAGALNFADLERWNNGRLDACEVGGWRVEPAYFERRRQFGEGPRPLILHSLAVREFESRELRHAAPDPEIADRLRTQARIIGIVFKPLQWILIGAGPFVRWRVQRHLRKSTGARPDDPLLAALASSSEEPFQRDGEWLVNRKYGCRIRAPERTPPSPHGLFRMPHEIFQFSA